LISIGIVLAVLTLSPVAHAQGCALCYTQAAASGARMIQALRNGIVVLIIPPLSMCLAAIFFAYRKRNQFNQSGSSLDSNCGW
jgi:hypothetical protein